MNLAQLILGRLLRGQLESIRLTIAASGTTSNAMDGRGGSAFGLVMPATFTGTAITFTVSHDNSTFQALYDINNAQVSMTVAVSRSYDLPTELFSWPFWKIVSGSTETGERSLWIVTKG